MQSAIFGCHILDSADPAAIGLDRKRQAGSASLSINMDRATAADAVLASDMGAGEPQLVSQKIAEQHANAHGSSDRLPVHGQRNFNHGVLGTHRN